MEHSDLPERYWIVATLGSLKFVLDLAEGERVSHLLGRHSESMQAELVFFSFRDFTDALVLLRYDRIDACYMSTPESRAFDDAMVTDQKKPGWGGREGEDE